MKIKIIYIYGKRSFQPMLKIELLRIKKKIYIYSNIVFICFKTCTRGDSNIILFCFDHLKIYKTRKTLVNG